jgi:phage terminase large subunit-like protein
MPWQQLVADVGLEVDPDTDQLAYREVVFTIMRQSGKSTLVLSFEVDRCVAWGRPQRIGYTAQTGWDARKKLLDDQVPVLAGSRLWPAVDKVYRAAGMEGVLWRSGSRIDVFASNVSAGHGRTLDLGVIDEAFDDEDERREQALLPAMATRADAQLLVTSTAGTSRSAYLRRKVDAGRHAVQLDRGHGIAYFEWSIPQGVDVDDPAVWWGHMPALGWTIQPEVVAHARQTMSDSEFRRGFCNQWVENADRWLPAGAWGGCLEERPIPDLAEVVLGFDGSYSNDSTALVAVEIGERPHIDVVECWERPEHAAESWRVPILAVEDAIRAACRRWQVREIVCDPARWARSYQILESEGLPVVEFPQTPQRMVPATQRFFEAVINKGLSQSGDRRLGRHIANTVLRADQRGARLSKDTKNSPRKIDLAVASVMALDRASQIPEQEQPFYGSWR